MTDETSSPTISHTTVCIFIKCNGCCFSRFGIQRMECHNRHPEMPIIRIVAHTHMNVYHNSREIACDCLTTLCFYAYQRITRVPSQSTRCSKYINVKSSKISNGIKLKTTRNCDFYEMKTVVCLV